MEECPPALGVEKLRHVECPACEIRYYSRKVIREDQHRRRKSQHHEIERAGRQRSCPSVTPGVEQQRDGREHEVGHVCRVEHRGDAKRNAARGDAKAAARRGIAIPTQHEQAKHHEKRRGRGRHRGASEVHVSGGRGEPDGRERAGRRIDQPTPKQSDEWDRRRGEQGEGQIQVAQAIETERGRNGGEPRKRRARARLFDGRAVCEADSLLDRRTGPRERLDDCGARIRPKIVHVHGARAWQLIEPKRRCVKRRARDYRDKRPTLHPNRLIWPANSGESVPQDCAAGLAVLHPRSLLHNRLKRSAAPRGSET